jgi:hypothetical protein
LLIEKQESSYITRMRKGYASRRKSRYHKLSSNIKIRNISYTYLSRIYYYIYKESNYFIADYNIKDNIRKFIIKLRKNKKKYRKIIWNNYISKGKKKNKSSRKT